MAGEPDPLGEYVPGEFAARAASSERAMYARVSKPPGLNSLARAERKAMSSPCARVAGATRYLPSALG